MRTPFCKVCFDTGKPESLYTSHYVNDVPGNKGVVVCPTLLALECRYCKQTGHTVSRCNMITEARKKQFASRRRAGTRSEPLSRSEPLRSEPLRSEPLSRSEPLRSEPRMNNRFSALEHEDVSAAAVVVAPVTTYASIVTTLVPLRIFPPRSPSTSPPPLVKMRWAECELDSDSDSD